MKFDKSYQNFFSRMEKSFDKEKEFRSIESIPDIKDWKFNKNDICLPCKRLNMYYEIDEALSPDKEENKKKIKSLEGSLNLTVSPSTKKVKTINGKSCKVFYDSSVREFECGKDCICMEALLVNFPRLIDLMKHFEGDITKISKSSVMTLISNFVVDEECKDMLKKWVSTKKLSVGKYLTLLRTNSIEITDDDLYDCLQSKQFFSMTKQGFNGHFEFEFSMNAFFKVRSCVPSLRTIRLFKKEFNSFVAKYPGMLPELGKRMIKITENASDWIETWPEDARKEMFENEKCEK